MRKFLKFLLFLFCLFALFLLFLGISLIALAIDTYAYWFVPILFASVLLYYKKRIPFGFGPGILYSFLFGILIFSILILAFARLWEAGFDDGPFRGKKISLEGVSFTQNESVPFREGELAVLESDPISGPILAYRKREKIEWAYLLETENQMPGTRIWKISNLSLENGIFRDRIHFTGTWTHGAERGLAFVWKFGGLDYFYLSW
ncbi:hypothetical protein [Leptospira wolffii]|uniref:hypothetical protein n=1 Tax=Leptospira wolffii TaxID=409998 RepID=UPI0002DFD171|nr:hypothetical protein [Leptospira wolffii]EPG67232.1 hypothetical protein LEP1GSC061_1449 [Leptospira wolffii serovar Khorat str. Khorat-H2]